MQDRDTNIMWLYLNGSIATNQKKSSLNFNQKSAQGLTWVYYRCLSFTPLLFPQALNYWPIILILPSKFEETNWIVRYLRQQSGMAKQTNRIKWMSDARITMQRSVYMPHCLTLVTVYWIKLDSDRAQIQSQNRAENHRRRKIRRRRRTKSK